LPEAGTLEKEFYRILEDLRQYLPDLVLVGGWVPFVYVRHVWKRKRARVVTTADVDFGVPGGTRTTPGKTVFETLSSRNYGERRLDSGRLWPVVLYKDGRIPVEFLADSTADMKAITAFLGTQVYVNRLERLDFLLKERFTVRSVKGTDGLFCPRPSRFLIHKLITFPEREEDFKKAKDLMYSYFILRHHPDIAGLMNEIRAFREEMDFSLIVKNLDLYFARLTSRGCLWVEKENGSDEFIPEVRRDIFERFQGLKRGLEMGG